MPFFYIHTNSGNSVFVKTEKFFKQQGGLTEKWGKAWTKINASSIEHARSIGENKKLKI